VTFDSIASRHEAVLLVIDEQERLTAVMPDRLGVVLAGVRLVRTAALVGVPIIVTRQYPRGLGDVEPDLAAALTTAGDVVPVRFADKVAFDCFGEPSFVAALEATGRRQLIIAGMETHICVVQTALSALRAGYDVHVVADACCSRDAACAETALARLRAAGAVVTVSESVMYELVGEAGTDEFRALLALVKSSAE
jgi:nicotinamidase-related amidase